jgi:hypothetical protein
VKQALVEAIDDVRAGSTDLSNRFASTEAKAARKAGIDVRTLMEAQWQ